MQRHIDPQEAQEIVLLAAERQSTPLDGPTVEGLAASLGLSESEVERMLAEVRARRSVSNVAPRRSFGDRSAALSAGIVLALVVVVAGIGGLGYLFFGLQARPVATTTLPVMNAVRVPPVPESPTMPATAAPAGDGRVTIQSSRDGKTTTIEGGGSKMKIHTGENGAAMFEEAR